MTTEQVLQKLRRTLNEVDSSTSRLTDPELLEALADARDELELEKVLGFEVLTVGSDQTDTATYGILPEASLTIELGTILQFRAAANVLRSTLSERTNRGEIGVSWTSGLESESTLQAAAAYRSMIADIEAKARSLILIKRAPTSGSRPQ